MNSINLPHPQTNVKRVFSAGNLFSRLRDFAVSRILIFADERTDHFLYLFLVLDTAIKNNTN